MWTNILPIIIPLSLIASLLLALWRIGLKKLQTYSSPFGKIEVFQKYNGEKMIAINSYPQGVSIEKESIRQSYWYKIAEQILKHCQNKKAPEVLMLGLGAGTIPNLIAQKNPKIRLTILEIDKFIIKACQKYFDLNALPNYQIIRTDVFEFFSKPQAFDRKFDAIIVDVFTGKPPYVSLKSNQPHFVEKLFFYLKEDGLIIFNRPAHNIQAKADGEILRDYLAKFFRTTEIYYIKDPRRFSNHVITAEKKLV